MMIILSFLAFAIVLYFLIDMMSGLKAIPTSRMLEFKYLFLTMNSAFEKKPSIRIQKMNKMLWVFKNKFPKEGLCRLNGLFVPSVLIYKPEIAQLILKGNVHLRKGFMYYIFNPWLKDSIFLSSGDSYRNKKKMLSPLFKVSKEFLSVFNEQSEILTAKISKAMETQRFIDIEPFISRCALDILFETHAGIKLLSQENPDLPYFQALHEFLLQAADRLCKPWLFMDIIYFRTKAGKESRKNLDIIKNFSAENLEKGFRETRQKISSGTSKLDGLFGNNLKEPGLFSEEKDPVIRKKHLFPELVYPYINVGYISYKEALDDFSGLLFAGHDTTTNTISWILYNLGIYPEIQRKVHAELDNVLRDHNKTLTEAKAKELKYLECVIKETLRLFPPVLHISRFLEADLHINEMKIPKGASCEISIEMIQRDPDTFPNPDVFNPDRFNESNSKGRHEFALISFSAGRRACLGQKYAMLEMIIVLATIMRKFTVKSSQPLDELTLIPGIILKSENGLFLNFKEREPLNNLI